MSCLNGRIITDANILVPLFSCRLHDAPNPTMARSIRRLLDLYDGHSVPSAIQSYDEDESAVKLLHMFHPVMLNLSLIHI